MEHHQAVAERIYAMQPVCQLLSYSLAAEKPEYGLHMQAYLLCIRCFAFGSDVYP